MHGGKSTGAPKGTRNALKHGFYAKGLLPHEKEAWHEVPILTLEDEIKVLRLRIRRILDAEARADGLNLETQEVRRDLMAEGEGGKLKPRAVTEVKKATDYHEILQRYIGKLAQLVKIQDEMRNSGAGDASDRAREIKITISEMRGTVESA